MTKPRSAPDTEHAAALARLTGLARDNLPAPGTAPDGAGYQRLRQALAQDGGPSVARRRWLIPATAGALAAVLAGGVYLMARPAPLTFTASVQHQVIDDGGYLAAPADSEAGLHFSDGTEVVLAPGSRTRVATTSARGARVTLDHGKAKVSVVPRPNGQWTFDAGPCVVQVTGTKFDIGWSSADQVLDVRLHSGSVTVKGPPAPAGLVMRAGQHLVMDVRHGFSRLDQSEAPAPAAAGKTAAVADPGAGAPAAPPAPSEGPPAVVAPPAPAAAGRSSRAGEPWPDRVLAGDFDGVLQAARRRGLGQVLGHAPAADVMALAQAARLGGDPTVARQALQAVRSRFPASGEARKAAFLLGRLAEDVDGDLTRALDWYGIYLGGAAHGTYAEEALGRKMTATLRLHGAEQARPLAEEYLRRFAGGGYADAARKLVKAPR